MPACISPIYIPAQQIAVPCGKCNFCLEKRRSEWTHRLLEEQAASCSSHFLTLTYDDDHLVFNTLSRLPSLYNRDLQLFIKRLRKAQLEAVGKTGPRLRYYAVGEYGTNYHRPHYHIILFNMHAKLLGKTQWILPGSPQGVYSPELQDIWKKGIVHVGTVTNASIHYVTKYVINRHTEDGSLRDIPKLSCHVDLGLGANTWKRTNNGTSPI